MKNLLNYSADIAATLGVVDGAKLDSTLASADVSLEDGGFAPSLGLELPNHPIGFVIMVVCIIQSP